MKRVITWVAQERAEMYTYRYKYKKKREKMNTKNTQSTLALSSDWNDRFQIN